MSDEIRPLIFDPEHYPEDGKAEGDGRAAPCAPQRWIRCKAFVEVMGERAEVEFKVRNELPCPGACEILARSNDEAVARYVAEATMKSGIEVVGSFMEHSRGPDPSR